MAESKGVEFEGLLLRGTVHTEVAGKVREIGADMLVMGELKELMSRKEIYHEEGERIFRDAGCPVVVVKNPAMVEQLYRELV